MRSSRARLGLERIFHESRREAQGFEGLERVEAARALWRIAPDERWLRAVLNVLGEAMFESSRFDAVQALEDFCHPDAERALIEILYEPASHQRHAAARSLLGMLGIAFTFGDHPHAIYRVMASDPAEQAEAKREILAMVAPTGSHPP